MSTHNFLSVSAVIAFLFGLAFLLVPEQMSDLYGLASRPALIFVGRVLGAAFLTIGLIIWLSKSSTDWTALRGVLVGIAAGDAIGAIVVIWGTTTGVVNSMGWSAVVFYVLLAVGGAYLANAGEAPKLV